MTARAKSLLLLLATLLIGMVLGALLQARIADERLERLAYLRSSRGFIHYMERVIEPLDAVQREAVRAILDDAAARLAEQRTQSRTETRAILDATRAELAEVLTPEQMQQLEERLRRGQERIERRRRGRDGPPPHRRLPPPRRGLE